MKKKVVKYRPKKTVKGKGFIEDANKFLKNTKLISKVAQVALPFGLGALGSVGGPLGTAVLGAVGQAGVEGLKNYGYGSKSMMRGGQGGGYQGSEYQNMTTALYSHKPSMAGGAVYSQGQIPIHKNTGAGVRGTLKNPKGGSTARDYKTRHVVVRKPIMVGGGVEGMSVYNDVVAQYGNPKF